MSQTLTKCTEIKLGGNCTRMLRAILNKSWKQPPTKQQMYHHLLPISKNHPSKTNKICGILLEKQGRTYKWRSSLDPLHMDVQVLVYQPKLIYISSVQTQNVVWKTCRGQGMIETDAERDTERERERERERWSNWNFQNNNWNFSLNIFLRTGT